MYEYLAMEVNMAAIWSFAYDHLPKCSRVFIQHSPSYFKVSQNHLQTFCTILCTDKQTNKQQNRLWRLHCLGHC